MESASATVIAQQPAHYVDWPAVFAGAVIASAIFFVLMSFGGAIGLSLTPTTTVQGTTFVGYAVGIGLWSLWVGVSSFLAGGYATGRLRRRIGDSTPHESEVRDGAHGALVWAASTLFVAFLASSAASGIASGTSRLTGGANSATDISDYALDTLFRPSTAANGAALSDPERAQAKRAIISALPKGAMDPADQAYVTQLMVKSTGIPQAEAQTRLDQFVAAQRTAVDRARRIAVIIGFLTAASLLLGGAAAWWSACLGGKHRDEGTQFAGLGWWR